jgi:DNA repair exonuclease SbcCD ATPase subunit
LTLAALEATDFCCFPELKLKLRKRGLVWLGGVNEDTASATSNGSGKSTVFKAIGWAAYGRSVDGADGDEVIRHGQKTAQTKLRFVEGYEAVRERRKGTGKLKLFKDGEEQHGSKEELQAQIDRLMGMDWQTFRNVAMYGQRDTKRFVHPETTDRERKEVLGRILNTGIYAVAHTWVKEQALQRRTDAARFGAEADKAAARIAEYDLADLGKQQRVWEAKRKERLAAKREQARELLSDAKDLVKDPPDIAALEKRLEDLREAKRAATALETDIDALEVVWDEYDAAAALASTVHVRAQSKASSAEAAWEKLNGDSDGVCPLCSGDLGSGNAAAHVAELKEAMDAANKALKKASAAWTEAKRLADDKAAEIKRAKLALRASRAESEGISEIQDEISEAKATAARAKAKREQAKLALEAASEIKDEANPMDAQIERAKERIAKATLEQHAADESFKAARVQLAHYEFWQRGFSPNGMPSFALDAVMPAISERANHYLETLADGDINVEFKTQRELKSAKGEFRDEIEMSWEIEGVAGLPPSGGQWKKMEIATNFALMDLVASQEGASTSILLLDEVFDGLDAEGVDRVGVLLQKLRAKRETIIVISHSATMQEWFERALVVEKKDGASALSAA